MYQNQFMKKLFAPLLFIILAVISFQCQKELSYDGGSVSPVASDPVTASLQGTVFDETGQPASGVSIKVGSKTIVTDTRGYFRVNNASLDKYQSLVTAEKTGYFKAIRTFNATSGTNQVMIKLIKKVSAGIINAATGGDVSLSNGAKVLLPANGVVNAQTNAAYTGNITVYATYIDPTAADIDRIIPGSFLATDKDNKKAILSSYGMMAVELVSSTGEKLQIAAGKAATLTTPIPASVASSAPATISLWYMDEQTGLWKEEGQATKSGSVYTGEVKHFTYWNCDVAGPTVNFTATFLKADGTPLSYFPVYIWPSAGYYGTAHGYTDSLGQVSGPVPANMNLTIQLMNPCGGVAFSQPIGPFSSNVNYGTITVPNNLVGLVTVRGKLVNCSNAPVTNGYAMIYYDYYLRYASVNSSGDFTTTFFTCSAPSTCSIIGVDNGGQQQSSIINVAVGTPTTNAGTISACGNSSQQYINYTVDGTSYSIPNDSLAIYGYQFAWSPEPFMARIYGYNNPNNQTIFFSFVNNGTPGSFPLDIYSIVNYNAIREEAPFNVTITSYPAIPGDFYEGQFTGQFRDSSDLIHLHTVNCSFRARRN